MEPRERRLVQQIPYIEVFVRDEHFYLNKSVEVGAAETVQSVKWMYTRMRIEIQNPDTHTNAKDIMGKLRQRILWAPWPVGQAS